MDLNILNKKLIDVLEDNKATDINLIDISGKSTIANYMIIASGNSDRQIKALAEKIAAYLRNNKIGCSVEGLDLRDWVLVDAFDVLVHIFKKDATADAEMKVYKTANPQGEDLAMENPIEPVTNFISDKAKTEVEFKRRKAEGKKKGGFFLKIGKFEFSKNKH